MGKRCIVASCISNFSSTEKVSYHKLRISDPIKYQKWLTAISVKNKQPEIFNHNNTAMICSKHFTEDSYKPGDLVRALNENAIPSIFPRDPDRISDSKIISEASHSTETTNIKEMSDEEEFEPIEPNMDADCETSIIDSTKTIIAENLECSSSDSFSYENDQNIFAANFTYKNPVFLQKRIDKYKEDLKKIMEEQEALEIKLLIQKATSKEIHKKTKRSKKIKEMVDFHEIYDKPQMNIPKLIFERFMVDYENAEWPEDLKRFGAEVYSRSADAYEYMQQCFTNVLPSVNDFQEFLKDSKSDDLSDEN